MPVVADALEIEGPNAVQSSPEDERRRYPRLSVRGGISVELRVEVSGAKPAILLTRGSVADISCGGVKCEIGLDVPVGTRVEVCFAGMPDAVLAPELMNGRVVRSESLGGVPDQLAIAFARPLEHLDIERLGATHAAAGAATQNGKSSWAAGTVPFPTAALGSFR